MHLFGYRDGKYRNYFKLQWFGRKGLSLVCKEGIIARCKGSIIYPASSGRQPAFLILPYGH